jgi:hypothetical protein
MPNLTFPVHRDQPPILTMVLGVTDAQDESLTAASQPVPQPVLAPALLDTGARTTIIARNVADELGLEPLGMRDVVGVAGSLSVPGTVHRVRLTFHLPGTIPIELDSWAEVISVEDLGRLGVRMSLGRDQLRKCVMIYNGPQDCCTFVV